MARGGSSQSSRVCVLSVLSLAAIVLSLLNQWLVFGFLCSAIMLLIMACGYGRQATRATVAITLIAMSLGYCALLAGIAWADRPDEEIRLLGGLPYGSALLVYGVWPLGTIAGLLYALVFDRSVLRQDKLQDFMAKFGPGKPG